MVYRVIQWSTGNVGAHAVRAIAGDPTLRLVGAYTYSGDKIGADVGEIVGTDRLGVRATDEVERLVETAADVVIHTPLPSLVHGDDSGLDLDVICRLLSSGKNVITVVGYMYPKAHGPSVVRRLERACRAGGTTFHGTGLNPGWLGELVPLTLSSLSRRIDRIHVTEITDFARYPSSKIMLDIMGFGKRPTVFRREGRRRREWLNGLFRESIELVADGLEYRLDRISESLEIDVAASSYDVAAGTIEAGTVAGQHWTWSGRIARQAVVTHETIWRMGPDAGADWPRGDHSVVIEGEPSMRVELGSGWLSDGLQATALHAVNAVPYVVDAASGIKTFLDLPWILGRNTRRRPR